MLLHVLSVFLLGLNHLNFWFASTVSVAVSRIPRTALTTVFFNVMSVMFHILRCISDVLSPLT